MQVCALSAFAAVLGCSAPTNEPAVLQEASDVAVKEGVALFVDDDEDDVIFAFDLGRLGEGCPDAGPAPVAGFSCTPLHSEDVSAVPLAAAQQGEDLEGIDVLADGTVIIASEAEGVLKVPTGTLVSYAAAQDLGNRGIEGLSVTQDPTGEEWVAVAIEGGCREGDDADCPKLLIHRLSEPPPTAGVTLPVPEGALHRWRVPALLWLEPPTDGQPGNVLVLLSCYHPRTSHNHKQLQVFSTDGVPLGGPVPFENLMPPSLPDRNWEGMAWRDGRTHDALLLCDDNPDGVPYLVEVPWKP